MTKFIRFIGLICALSLAPLPAVALDSQELPDVKDGVVTIKTLDPVKRVGYTVGDIIEREVILTIKAPYKLIDTSLPIKGYEKRYRGQLIGIELKNIDHKKEVHKNYTIHNIKLAYQVFTNSVVAKNAALGPEYLNLINAKNSKDLVKYRVPSLDIAISPIAIFGAVKVENNMSQFLEPLQISSDNEKHWLKVTLTTLALSLLGLLYIVGKHAWLPRMGGPFASAYRTLRKTKNDEEGLRQAVSKLHQSFNSMATMTIFNDNLDLFLIKHPNFSPLKPEIQQFFGLSRQVYFEPDAAHDLGADPHQWLVQFARRCRDCERGLLPTPLNTKVGA